MTASARYDINIDQGTDHAVQVYWTSSDDVPFQVIEPIRMDIADGATSIVATLRTDSSSSNYTVGDQDLPQIAFNTSTGLIQVFFSDELTERLAPGQYTYDLFTTYMDDELTQTVRTYKVLHGNINIAGRITRNV